MSTEPTPTSEPLCRWTRPDAIAFFCALGTFAIFCVAGVLSLIEVARIVVGDPCED